jgi:hypothetical protein
MPAFDGPDEEGPCPDCWAQYRAEGQPVPSWADPNCDECQWPDEPVVLRGWAPDHKAVREIVSPLRPGSDGDRAFWARRERNEL